MKTWKLGQESHTGKTQETPKQGTARLVPVSLRGHKEVGITKVLEKLQTAFSFCYRKKLLLWE